MSLPEPTGRVGPLTQETPVDEHVGPYRLRFEIAAGGMAKVFLAVKEGPGGFSKVFAVKKIHDHLAHEQDFVEMFLDEARICSQINHPNVCAILDFGTDKGAQFLAMEFMIGEPLRAVHKAMTRTERHARDAILAARLVADVCEGLHAAHELRNPSGEALHVVHRDISPQNVFVTYDGAVKVMDFGIATARDRVHHTDTGLVKGKFAYMSPEQVRGDTVDRRADVWALGVVLWETVALRRLFGRKNDAETVLALINEPIPPLATSATDPLAGLDRIIARALDRNLASRYATARELGRDLNRWIASRGEHVGNVEIADWMHTLFPGGAARKQQLVRLAQTDRAVPKVYQPDSVTTGSGLMSAVRERPEAETARKRRVKSHRSTGIAAGAIALGALVVGGLTYALTRGDDESAEPATLASAAPHEAAPVTPPASPPPIAAPAPVAAPAPTAPEPTAPEPVGAPPIARAEAPEAEGPVEPAVVAAPAVETTTPAPVATTARERARRPPATVASGTVDVATPGGWAEVYLGRRRLGTTPGHFTLPAGHHVLRIHPFGEASGARDAPVDVRAGESVRLRINLR